jgi:phage tail-like protein
VARYGSFLYGTATYGIPPRLAYSVNPMTLTVLDFNKTYLTWQLPTGSFSRIRLVRSQSGYPEDGVILWDELATEGNVTRDDFTDPDDGTNIEDIEPGRQIYYSMFLLVDAGYWIVAGQISDLVPSNHSVQSKMMDIIPRVYTSNIQSPIGVVDETSALYDFIDGLSFTYEQLLTQTDLARPNHAADKTPESLIPIETLNVGLDYEPNIPVRNRKRLVREAIYMYNHKGTKLGLETYVESLTNYSPTITVSPNLFLTVQDSTFYNSVGNWQTNACTISSVTSQVPPTSTKVIDEEYTCQVVAASGSAYITLGESAPITLGVPVAESTEYTFGFQGKSPTSAGNITLTAKWYDKNGTYISATSATALSANNTWQSKWKTATTPADTRYATFKFEFSAAGTYYIDQVDIHEGSETSYDEARAINVYLSPNKSNYINNPSFEGTTNEWTITSSGDSLDSDVPLDIISGSQSLLVDLTTGATLETTTNVVPVTEKYFTLSFYAKATSTLTDSMTITLTPRDNSTDITSAEVTSTVTLTDSWQRYAVTTYVDADSVTTSLDFVVNVTVDSASGEDGYFDSFQLEASQVATDPFDGNLSSQFGVVWEGTANESPSHMYYGKALKVPRLSKTLTSWVPPNSFWRIETFDGVEYTNLSV